MEKEFPSNTRKQTKPEVEQKQVKKVITGEVVRRKKPLRKRFAETFVAGDTRGVWSFMVFEILVPAAKDMVSDAMSAGTDRMLYGETRRPGRRGRGGRGHVSYGANYRSPIHEEPRLQMSRRARATHDFDDIILDTRVEAEEVIDGLFTLVSQYEVATVSDLYEMVGIVATHTDNKWGWTDLRGAGVVRTRDGGYLLDLPRPEPID